MTCGCKVDFRRTQRGALSRMIVFCPLHAAASELVDDLKAARISIIRNFLCATHGPERSELEQLALRIETTLEKVGVKL